MTNFLGHRVEDVEQGISAVENESFKVFMQIYNKSYSVQELPRRMALFFDRRKMIQESIQAFSEGRLPFRMRENSFIDRDETELKALTGVSLPKFQELLPVEQQNLMAENPIYQQAEHQRQQSRNRRSLSIFDFLDDPSPPSRAVSIPASKDWRQTNCVYPVRSQGDCGACYAIASTTVLESMRCINGQTNAPVLSPQQVVDCATSRRGYQNFGCDGGWPTRALQYLKDEGKVDREACYPFMRHQTTCKETIENKQGCSVSSSPTDTRMNFKVLTNEDDVLYHVAKTGPVATVIKATDKFMYYGAGVFDDPSCSKMRSDVDHAVVIVGYGSEHGKDYWLIKNSWGTDWGINGYAKFKRGTNACSIGHWGWVVTS